MQRINAMWNKGVGGKIALLGGAFIAVCLACGILITIFPGQQAAPQPTLDVGSIQTSAVESAVALLTQNAPTLTFTPAITDTPVNTATPEFTPTITDTPGPPTATIDVLKLDKTDGFYLVNSEIAPGVWRSDGTASDCYWSVTTATGDIIDNHFGAAGGTAFIPPTAFQVEFRGCGNWTFLQSP